MPLQLENTNYDQIVYPREMKEGQIGVIISCNYKENLNLIIQRVRNEMVVLGDVNRNRSWKIAPVDVKVMIRILPLGSIFKLV